MRLSMLLLPFAGMALADSWLGRTAYNKWHQTDLESWLDDHNIPHPKAADRRDLYELVQKNWDTYAVPYKSWSPEQLTAYLRDKKNIAVDEAKATDTNWLLEQVRSSWYETDDKARDAYGSVKDWILDSWSDSTLKSFCDRHGISVPQPRDRDVLLKQARQNYEAVAKKSKATVGYPGNWLYDTWTESDLKEWLDKHGVPVPQPAQRDQLIASVRRNSYLAHLQLQDQSSKAKAALREAYQQLSDTLLDSWSESQLKAFADKNGITVPQGTRVDELRALLRRQKALLFKDAATDTLKAGFGAATTKAGNVYAQATNAASEAANEAFGHAVGAWTDSRLKGFLEARGVPVPHRSTTDQLRALVRKNAYKASTGWSAWTFDDLNADTLRAYLQSTGDAAAAKAAANAGAARSELVKAAKAAHAAAAKKGTQASAGLDKLLQSAKDAAFDTWSDSEVKAYLDSYGVTVPQGTKANELRALARQTATFFRYGTTTPSGTLYAKASEGFWHSLDWAKAKVAAGAEAAKKHADGWRNHYYEL